MIVPAPGLDKQEIPGQQIRIDLPTDPDYPSQPDDDRGRGMLVRGCG